MDTLTLFDKVDQSQPTFAARVAAFFHERPNQWIDGRTLATIAGCYGWRTRVSDCRRAPFLMTIRNRQRRITKADGSFYIASEYCYLPDKRSEESAADGVSPSPAAA